MKLLLVDTTTTTCSVALTVGERISSEVLLDLDKNLSRRLLTCIGAVLDDGGLGLTDLDGIGVALGPGSFTGLRIGLASVKGLAIASDKPVAGFSSLAMLAQNLPWSLHQVCPMFDARKKEVYTALYQCREIPEVIDPDTVMIPELFLDRIASPTIFVGDGALRYRDLIVSRLGERAILAPPLCHQPRASQAAPLVTQILKRGKVEPLGSIVPTYIRPSEAEVAKMNR